MDILLLPYHQGWRSMTCIYTLQKSSLSQATLRTWPVLQTQAPPMPPPPSCPLVWVEHILDLPGRTPFALKRRRLLSNGNTHMHPQPHTVSSHRIQRILDHKLPMMGPKRCVNWFLLIWLISCSNMLKLPTDKLKFFRLGSVLLSVLKRAPLLS